MAARDGTMLRRRMLAQSALLLAVGCGASPSRVPGTGGPGPSATHPPAVVAGSAAQPPGDDTGARSRQRRGLRTAIDRAVDYLVRSCGPQGRFVYRTHVDPSVTLPAAYNVVRHAGAMYALASYLKRWPRPEVAAALRRAGRYLEERHLTPLRAHPALSAIWSREISRGRREAKLGASGLGLVALGEAAAVGAVPFAPSRQAALGGFLRFMQKPDGSFYSKYLPEGTGRDDSWTSLYYPGEAALGLLTLYRRDRDGVWLRAAGEALAALARLRQGRARVAADHWALIATAELLRLAPSAPSAVRAGIDVPLLVAHVAQICRSILAARTAHRTGSALAGCFGRDGRTTPTATRLEGLIAALAVLGPEHAALRTSMRRAIDEGVAFLLRAQLDRGPLAGALPRALASVQVATDPAAPDPRAGEVRIDYVQHATSAWLGYLVLLQREAAARRAREALRQR